MRLSCAGISTRRWTRCGPDRRRGTVLSVALLPRAALRPAAGQAAAHPPAALRLDSLHAEFARGLPPGRRAVTISRPVSQAAADENLVTHMTWVQARLAGGHVDAGPELVLSDSGIPCDTFNFVCRARLDAGPSGAIRRVVEYFRRVARPFSWWVGPADRPAGLGGALAEAGLVAAESEVAMAADLDALGSAELAPHGLRIVRVGTAAQVDEFARINAANWSPPDLHVLRFYRLAAPLLLRPEAPLRLYLGYLGEDPVATAELTVSAGAVGLYNIATLAGHRRKGIGTALTLRPLLDARAEGHALAVLQASADGVGVYRRLGFRETGRYTEYQLPPRGAGTGG